MYQELRISTVRFNEKTNKLVVPKPRTTTTINNEEWFNYGSFVLPNIVGDLGIASFGLVNLRSLVEHGGNAETVGKVNRKDGANYKIYLFDINMNSGQSFRNVKSIGSSATDYINLILIK